MSWKAKILVLLALLALPVVAWKARFLLTRLFPIDHEGTVMRIATFRKGGFNSRNEDTRQLNQFAIIFDDGFDCEGYDTSLAAVREGDVIRLRGYHDVKGFPVLDPEWWECDEAQLVGFVK
ncbi:MAG: hypothetical protein H6739_40785 [Alphaproteobacteria bacterium]|nr:hypothetical protein [Alphaproteobacteria bacterium]